jgi:hypothetical protein
MGWERLSDGQTTDSGLMQKDNGRLQSRIKRVPEKYGQGEVCNKAKGNM